MTDAKIQLQIKRNEQLKCLTHSDHQIQAVWEQRRIISETRAVTAADFDRQVQPQTQTRTLTENGVLGAGGGA